MRMLDDISWSVKPYFRPTPASAGELRPGELRHQDGYIRYKRELNLAALPFERVLWLSAVSVHTYSKL